MTEVLAGGAMGAAPAAPSSLRRSLWVYGGLMAYLAAIRLTLSALATSGFRSPSQAAVFAWPVLGVLTVAGFGGVWLSHRVALPGLWDPGGNVRRRVLLPAAIGAAFGLLAIGADLVTGWTRAAAQQMGLPSIHIEFPASLLIYPGGAVIVDVIYYLVPIPLLLWLFADVVAQGRGRRTIFWVVGLLAAAIEPMTQDLRSPGGPGVGALLFMQDYALNAAQVIALRRTGFLSAVLLRVVFYLVWHVLWGALGAHGD
jgi:hypothetical protein